MVSDMETVSLVSLRNTASGLNWVFELYDW